jgi:hypothetical protein
MASASKTLEFAVALSLLPALAWAGPVLSGTFRVEPFGRMELTTEGDLVAGVTASGNSCKFEERRRVLEGAFEGSVLVGTVTLCQSGAGCEPEQVYPLLAVYSPADGSLTAHVRLSPGCQSPALLKGGRLVWVPASAPQAASEQEGLVAGKRGELRLSRETIDAALRKGDALFKQGQYALATEQFQGVVDHDANNPVANHLLGASLLMQRQEHKAIDALKKARKLKKWETFYLLACAYSRTGERKQGLSSLRQALKLGNSVDVAKWSEDTDLINLLGSQQELKAFLMQAPGAKQAQTRDRLNSSDP